MIMKELSIEEKAKAYDEALKYAMIYYKDGNEDMKMMMKTCFPVLTEESEDERIRKEIIAFLTYYHTGQGNSVKYDDNWIAWLEKQGEQKPVEWSEEDDILLNDAIYTIKEGERFENELKHENCHDSHTYQVIISWLKSLKDRVRPQPKQEWSEDDEEKFRDVIRLIEQGAPVQSMRDHYTNWLKSLRPQNTWKPSDEQMKALADALSLAKNCGEEIAFDLRTLYEQLKKLRKE